MNAVVSVCKRGHRSYGHSNYCGECGTKFFHCGNCGGEVSFDEHHACASVSPSALTVGRYWVDSEEQVWKQIAYTDQPVASFECVDGRSKHKRLDEVVGCLNMSSRGLRLLRSTADEIGSSPDLGSRPCPSCGCGSPSHTVDCEQADAA